MSRAVAALLLLLAGCSYIPGSDRERWEREITDAVNDHGRRLRAIEGAGRPDPTPSPRHPPQLE